MTQSPQISEVQMVSIKKYIEMGIKEGAKVLETRVVENHNKNGYFIKPVIFYDVVNSNIVMKKEI